MRIIIAAAAAVALLWSGAASAQTNTVSEHYRAYRAALAGGDLVAAEREAATALSASEARDGDGGATAVLALNLAQTRLDAGLGASAVAPAQRALALAQTRGTDSRVDPLVARLLLGRAQLAANETAAPAQLRAALDEAAARARYEEPGFLAARDLATALRRESASQSLPVWDMAIVFAAAEDKALWRSEGLIGRGEALLETSDFVRRRATGTNIPIRHDTRAADAFREAATTLGPIIQGAQPTQGVTVAEMLFGRAMAYFGLIGTLQMSTDRDSERGRSFVIARNRTDDVPVCSFRFVREPMPEYPDDALARWGVGAVALRLRTDESGRVQDVAILAALGGQSFIDAVTAAAPQWRLEPIDPSATCTRSVTMYSPTLFVLRGFAGYDAR